ncbi:glutamyl-tRNA reductase [Georgenia sp. SYP-B2076]|uniref:glutamyl-tRNA reductase n=1 Tax=Georgenia sp. SYP-B2076 TaxID=2495881 RepID=UPI001F0BE1DE|nr:glutamyl-tRNA reductase [Georgenia sp. SYP-B2076]
MVLILLSANHHDLDLADIERLSAGASDVGRQVVADWPAVRGAVVLATCNRFELYLDAGTDAEDAVRAAHQAVASTSGTDPAEVARLMRAQAGEPAVQHLFEVASGLDSMVVGEREITGQVRRALDAARAEGLTSPLLERTLQHATRTSRQVAVDTDLARAGRSVVAVALDLAAARVQAHACERHGGAWPQDPHASPVPHGSWAGRRALLVGTGSYAGASLAALRERGATDVAVWSASGRAHAFAESHGTAEAPQDLATALARTDLVVTCRGTGTPVLGVATVAEAVRARRERGETAPLVLVDLALQHDIDPAAATLDGVVHVNLPTVREHAPAATVGEVARAREIVADGVRALADDGAERRMADAVVALRTTVEEAVAAEIARLPADGTMPAEDAARALRRLAARLVHTPTVRARAAGREGHGAEHLRALEQVLGVTVPGPGDPAAGAPAPAAPGPGTSAPDATGAALACPADAADRALTCPVDTSLPARPEGAGTDPYLAVATTAPHPALRPADLQGRR